MSDIKFLYDYMKLCENMCRFIIKINGYLNRNLNVQIRNKIDSNSLNENILIFVVTYSITLF